MTARLKVVLAMVLLMAGVNAAWAADYTWNNVNAAVWSTPTAWTPSGPPGANNNAILFNNGGTLLTMNIGAGPVAVSNLFSSGSGYYRWDNGGTLTLGGTFVYSNSNANIARFIGPLAGGGGLRVESGVLQMEYTNNTFSGGIEINGGRLNALGGNAGTLNNWGVSGNAIQLGATGGAARDATLGVPAGPANSTIGCTYPQQITVRAGNAGQAIIAGTYIYYNNFIGYCGPVTIQKDVLFRNDFYSGEYLHNYITDSRCAIGIGKISGAFNVSKDGVGRVLLSADNDYNGTTTVNGGTLYLTGGAKSNTGNFYVRRGTLMVETNTTLGNAINTITLGGPGGLGGLAPVTTVGNPEVVRAITLEGVGGMISTRGSGRPIVSGPITGSGRLILAQGGSASVSSYVDGNNSYSGGTIAVDGHLDIFYPANYSRTVYGTGPVRILHSGKLYIRHANNVAAGQPVTIQDPGTLVLTSGDAVPTISTNSTGWLGFVDNIGGASTISARLADGGNPIGNGSMWFAYVGQFNRYFYGPSLAALVANDATRTYRLRSPTPNNILGLDAATTEGALKDLGGQTHNVTTYGLVVLGDTNSFTGSLTVEGILRAYLPGGTTTGSPVGGGGTVRLNQGTLALYNSAANNRTVNKGALTHSSGSAIGIDAVTVTPAFTTELALGGLTRDDRATLSISSVRQPLGSWERVTVSGGVGSSQGMTEPYLWNNSALTFVDYVAPYGFTNATWNFTALAGAGANDKVYLSGGGTVSANQTIHALRTDGILAAGGGTLTLQRGGLILGGAGSPTHTAPVGFGTAEGVIHVGTAGQTHTLNGAVSGSGGLTKSGPGNLTLGVANAGLSGDVHVLQGLLTVAADDRLGAGNVVLNGGRFQTTAAATTCSKNFTVGVLNGYLVQGTYNGNFSGPGRLVFEGANQYVTLNGTNSCTGGLWVKQTYNVTVGVNGSLGSGPVWIAAGNLGLILNGDNNAISNTIALESLNAAGYYSTLFFGTANPKCGSISGAGKVQLNVDNATLSLGHDNASTEYFGMIVSTAPLMNHKLVKVGTGTFTLWGESWLWGGTVVTGGTMVVNNYINPAGPVTVYPGATLDGLGTVGIVSNQGGTVKGNLSMRQLVMAAGSTNAVTLSGTNAVSQYGQLNVSEGVKLETGSVLHLTLGFAPAVGQSFTILNNTSGTINGTFGNSITAEYGGRNYFFSIDYSGGDVVLTRLVTGTIMTIR